MAFEVANDRPNVAEREATSRINHAHPVEGIAQAGANGAEIIDICAHAALLNRRCRISRADRGHIAALNIRLEAHHDVWAETHELAVEIVADQDPAEGAVD